MRLKGLVDDGLANDGLVDEVAVKLEITDCPMIQSGVAWSGFQGLWLFTNSSAPAINH